MVNPKGKKTVSFLVRDDFEHGGAVVKAAVDELLGAMYKMLSSDQKSEIKSRFKKEMGVLSW